MHGGREVEQTVNHAEKNCSSGLDREGGADQTTCLSEVGFNSPSQAGSVW